MIPGEIIAIPTMLRMRANVDVIEEIWIRNISPGRPMKISPSMIIRMTAIDATAGERRKKIAARDLHPTDGNRNGTSDQKGFPATCEQSHSLPKSSQAVVDASL